MNTEPNIIEIEKYVKNLSHSTKSLDKLRIIPMAKYIELAVVLSIIHATDEMCTKSSNTLVKNHLAPFGSTFVSDIRQPFCLDQGLSSCRY
jgi:hypothetical protein